MRRYGTRRCHAYRRFYALRCYERSRGNEDAFSPSSLVNTGPVQVGDPRMDSGLILDEEAERPHFNPLAPLLPEEVCYILDRAITCEVRLPGTFPYLCLTTYYKMEWHAGYTLPQTIYSCLYVHHLADINPEVVLRQGHTHQDPARPMELVTVVLNAAITGLLKCCDLAWRQLSRGKLHDVGSRMFSYVHH
jgi:N-alpha-acetyltransferase 35, NatC auxiliary subunit